MDVPPHNDNERFRRLSLLGRIGWWEADFSAEQYLWGTCKNLCLAKYL